MKNTNYKGEVKETEKFLDGNHSQVLLMYIIFVFTRMYITLS